MDDIVWKPILITNGKYSVSNTGLIKNNDTNRLRKLIVRKDKGYYRVPVVISGGPKDLSVHREVTKAFIPNPCNKPCINHIDGVKTNNVVSNLEWVTIKENTIHAYRIGLMNIKRCRQRKLSNEQIEQIVKEYVRNSREFGTTALGIKYNVSPVTIWEVLKKSLLTAEQRMW